MNVTSGNWPQFCSVLSGAGIRNAEITQVKLRCVKTAYHKGVAGCTIMLVKAAVNFYFLFIRTLTNITLKRKLSGKIHELLFENMIFRL
jgi:hypothetical protein